MIYTYRIYEGDESLATMHDTVKNTISNDGYDLHELTNRIKLVPELPPEFCTQDVSVIRVKGK
jgi:hypothetical protein